MANLDFAPYYGNIFKSVGDESSSQLMDKIYQDEISHVAFGYGWLKKENKSSNCFHEKWLDHLPDLIEPKRAKGPLFNPEGRKKAGLKEDYILFLKEL
jgi:uncharacterized ferritin-like protein (DUF455 family)